MRQAFGVTLLASLLTIGILGTMGQVHIRRGDVPVSLVAFYNGTACPAGWAELTEARGRYIVGRNSGGTLLAQVGTALTDQENRATGSHTHRIEHRHTSGSAGLHVISPVTGSTPSLLDWETNTPSGAVTGTNAPYLQLTACQKL